MAVVRHWMAFRDGDLSMAWATLEAPLVQLGSMHLPYAPFPPTVEVEPGTLYSWALTNIWDTNFPAQQAGETTFRYAISSAAGRSPRNLGAETAAGLTDPLLAVLASGSGAAGPASGSFCSVDHPDVQVTSIGRSRYGHSLVLRLRSLASAPVTASVAVPGAVAGFVCGPWERDPSPVPLRDGRFLVPVPAAGTAELVVDVHEDH